MNALTIALWLGVFLLTVGFVICLVALNDWIGDVGAWFVRLGLVCLLFAGGSFAYERWYNRPPVAYTK